MDILPSVRKMQWYFCLATAVALVVFGVSLAIWSTYLSTDDTDGLTIQTRNIGGSTVPAFPKNYLPLLAILGAWGMVGLYTRVLRVQGVQSIQPHLIVRDLFSIRGPPGGRGIL